MNENLNNELSTLQTHYTINVCQLADKYGVNRNGLLSQSAFSILRIGNSQDLSDLLIQEKE